MVLLQKIDYFSIVLDNVTLNDILKKFGYNPENVKQDFLWSRSDIDRTYEYLVMFRMPDFRAMVYIWYNEPVMSQGENPYIYESYMDEFLDQKHRVKLELAGAELDNFRARGFFPEEMLKDPDFFADICTSSSLTRVDFAYDFLDHESCPELPEKLCVYLNEKAAQKQFNLSTRDNRRGGLKFSTVFNDDEACAYLGAIRSPEFVRIYDKKLEYQKKFKTELCMLPDWYPEEYRNAKSWTRIELQARRDHAIKLLYTDRDVTDMMNGVLKHIFSRFCICDAPGVPCSFLASYFDWDSLPTVDFVQLREAKVNDVISIAKSHFYKYFGSILLLMGLEGVQGLAEKANIYLDYLYQSKLVNATQLRSRLSCRLAAAALMENKSLDKFPGFEIVNGHLYVCKEKKVATDEDSGDFDEL